MLISESSFSLSGCIFLYPFPIVSLQIDTNIMRHVRNIVKSSYKLRTARTIQSLFGFSLTLVIISLIGWVILQQISHKSVWFYSDSSDYYSDWMGDTAANLSQICLVLH